MDKVPTGPISIVSDSYDIFNMVEHIMGEELKEKVNISLFYVDWSLFLNKNMNVNDCLIKVFI